MSVRGGPVVRESQVVGHALMLLSAYESFGGGGGTLTIMQSFFSSNATRAHMRIMTVAYLLDGRGVFSKLFGKIKMPFRDFR